MAASNARLFFALWPDAATRATLARWQQMLHAACGGRVMDAQDLHLTLAFLGDTAAEHHVKAAACAAHVCAAPFTLRFERTGCWTHNRIAWAGLATPSRPLEALARQLRDALTAAVVAFDTKAFTPHVTLLRHADCTASPAQPTPLTWRVDAFALLRSTGARTGPRYRVERVWALRDTSG